MKKDLISGWFISIISIILFLPSACFSLTAEEVMEAVIENIKGPSGMMLSAEGRMIFAGRDIELAVARYCLSEKEGFQVDFLSMVEGIYGAPESERRYRVIRQGNSVDALIYLQSLRRGRKLNYVEMDGVLGSDYRFYWLTTASLLQNDFTYEWEKKNLILGRKKERSRSPFVSARLFIREIQGVHVLQNVEWNREKDSTPIIQTFEEYREVENAEGYFAPAKVTIGNTALLFTSWNSVKPLDWILSTNHALIELQRLPLPRKAK